MSYTNLDVWLMFILCLQLYTCADTFFFQITKNNFTNDIHYTICNKDFIKLKVQIIKSKK